MIQKSLILLKPDAVARGLSGEIISRIERTGLKVVAAKLIKSELAKGRTHYQKDDEWKFKVGERAIQECQDFNLDILEVFGTNSPIEIGNLVVERNAEFLNSGAVFAMIFQGPNAVKKIRNLIGSTFPESANPGTIRGDFGLENSFTGTKRKRTTYNLIHASGSVEEAEEEIKIWFNENEIVDYRQVHEDLYGY
jgi:nucleoside-diphosphate kinase